MDFETFVSSRSGASLRYLTTTLNSRHHLPKSAVGSEKSLFSLQARVAPSGHSLRWASDTKLCTPYSLVLSYVFDSCHRLREIARCLCRRPPDEIIAPGIIHSAAIPRSM